jgi:hypothetical protein
MPITTIPGRITGTTGQVVIKTGGSQTWIVSQITTNAPAAAFTATCKIRRNGVIIVPFMVPTGDVASGEPPIEIGPSDTITVDWTGVTAAVAIEATAIYEKA